MINSYHNTEKFCTYYVHKLIAEKYVDEDKLVDENLRYYHYWLIIN